MANKTVRLITNSKEFPFSYDQVSRSVTESTDLNQRMPGAFFGAVENAEFGVPQLVFCKNVLPYAKGIMSIGFGQQVPAFGTPVTSFDQAITLRDASENQFTFSPAKGTNYVLDPTTLTWTSVNPFTFTGSLVTRAYVNGRTFICYEADRIIEYVAGVFNTIALTLPPGVTMANIRGIGHASNYLLFFTDLAVYWCSPLNILDFNNMDQGAGNQTPTDIKGKITAILACSGGFIVYSARNAVGARYTNNSNGPFAFKEIANSGGVANWERVTADNNDVGHYIWGSNGLQQVDLNQAITIHPQATDFLVGNRVQTWIAATKAVEITAIGAPFSVKLSFLAGRYLTISYGQGRNDFDGCLMYDTALERWGQVTINHSDVYMYAYPSAAGDYFYNQLTNFYTDLGEDTYNDLGTTRLLVTPAKRGIAFLKNTGEIQILNTDFAQASADGVAVFGRLQQRHDRNITITDIEIDGLKDTPTPTVTLLGSEFGATRDTVVPGVLTDNANGYKRYQYRVTARNFDVAFEGNFVTSNIFVGALSHGYR